MEIHGFCDGKFSRVREEFERNFDERGDVGASFAATVNGEFVIDLWAGHADAARTRPWNEDTIVNVYSTTKTMTFISALVLADRGELDFNAPVSRYWPEYAANGKEKTEVRHFMSHSAGVPGFAPVLSAAELYDWAGAIENLAAQKPWWEPGTQSGYHAITQGFLIGEVIRRITGKTMGTFFADEIAGPLDADFHIGVSPSDFPRVAQMIPAPPVEGGAFGNMDPDSITARVFASTDLGNDAVNSPGWRQAEIPAANGHGNARSVVRAQTPLANNGSAFGVDLLSAAGCKTMLEEQTNGTDAVLMMPIRFGMGYAFPNPLMPMSPSETGMFWGGAGGSTIIIDQQNKACFSYVMNQMAAAIVGDVRGGALGKAFYESL
ncbi:MAG: serine hydrolase [Proteobacteria bacterium]|nr:serine hydrolase [Pseudomonadota bacterium]